MALAELMTFLIQNPFFLLSVLFVSIVTMHPAIHIRNLGQLSSSFWSGRPGACNLAALCATTPLQ